MIQQALGEGNTDEALKRVDEGERYDLEHNEGKRHSDYELRRGQIHVKRKDATQEQREKLQGLSLVYLPLLQAKLGTWVNERQRVGLF